MQMWETIRAHNQKHLRNTIHNFNNRRINLMNITTETVIERIKMLQAQILDCERNHTLLHGRIEEMKELLRYIASEENKNPTNVAEDVAIAESIEVTKDNIVTLSEETQATGEESCESNTN